MFFTICPNQQEKPGMSMHFCQESDKPAGWIFMDDIWRAGLEYHFFVKDHI